MALNRLMPLTAAWAIVVCVSCASLAGATQGLAEAARRAQEQSRKNAGQATRIEIVQGDRLAPVKLDRKVVDDYFNLRIAMAKLWHRNPNLYSQVRVAFQNARTLGEACSALASEPAVAELLTLYHHTPESFLATEVSIRKAERLTEGGFDWSRQTPIEIENYHWMGKDHGWVSIARGRVLKAEEGMSIW